MPRRYGWMLLSVALAGPLPAQHRLTPRDSALHVLNRLAYGPSPGLLEQVVREGVLRWVDRQLAVDDLDDPGLADALSRYELLRTSQAALLRRYVDVRQDRRAAQRAAGGGADSMQPRMRPDARGMRRLGGELQDLVLVRATLSERQLGEVMADFWINHFNIFVGKKLDRVYLPGYVEETVRPQALGRFEELLIATARSPAMMVYLDNAQSVAPGSRPPALERLDRQRGLRGRLRPTAGMDSLRQRLAARRPSGLNENYARELLELHTLGVDGGYTQADVTEVARILTGWSVAPPARGGGFAFNAWAHDRGAKRVLGIEFPAGQDEEEGVRLLKLLAAHPSTLHFVSGKLCARFVSDIPPDGCIDDAVKAWKQSDGDIRTVLRAVFRSPDFWAAANVGTKVKTPLEFVASAVRAVGGIPDTTLRLAQVVARLGQPLYQHVAPNGYGEKQADWVNSGALLNRMNVAVALAANRLPGVRVELDDLLPLGMAHAGLVDSVSRVILGGRMTAQTRKVILEQLDGVTNPVQARALAVGLAIGGPEFQRQ